MTTTQQPQATQAEVDLFVQNNVHYCVSMLIYDLAQEPKFSEELYEAGLLFKDDWETSAKENGFVRLRGKRSKIKSLTKTGRTFDTWQEACESENIDPVIIEALEHWIISDYLSLKLLAKGEMVCDFHGLTLWGRRTSGQAIHMDSVICEIYEDMKKESASYTS